MEEEQLLVDEPSDDEKIRRVIRNSLTSFRDAFQLTCRSNDQPHNQCGTCKTCRVDIQIHAAKDWWLQSGDLMKRRFLLALVHRLKPEILEQLAQMLKPFVDGKDYTYTRNKFDPNLTLINESNNDKEENDPIKRQDDLTKLILWFNHEDKYSQGSFILTILQWCDSHLIFTIALNIFSIYDMDSEDEDHRSDPNNMSRLKMSSVMSYPSSGVSPMSSAAPILKRPKTTSSASLRQKSAVSFASTTMENLDSDTEQAPAQKRTPKYKDFIRQLPIYLAKSILSMLDEKSLNRCKYVSTYWKKMATEVEDEATMTNMLYDDMMLLQGSAALQCNPHFARDTLVPVPDLLRANNSEKPSGRKSIWDEKSTSAWKKLYEAHEINTRLVLMEERNVYCGPYNVLLLKDNSDRRRTVHMSGESVVAISSSDSRVHFIDMQSAQERPTLLIGHAASIRCMVVQEDRKKMFTGSYDLTVRAWNLETGRCTKLYQGHERTVTCLAVFLDLIAAGGNDNLCLVWKSKYTRPWRTFKHKHPISAVAINDTFTLSGDLQGKIKVWHTVNATLIKSIKHRLMITSVKIDKWHIASSSHDAYASVWTSQGSLTKPLCTFRHPKEVLCMEFLYLRLITGCADGKIRIWSALNGRCLRVMRGNSRSDPVTNLVVTPNRMLVNTQSNLLLMNFEEIKYDYNLEVDELPVARTPTPPTVPNSPNRRKRSGTQRQISSILKFTESKEPAKEKSQEPKVLFDNEKLELDLSLDETKELLKRQIRGGVDEKRKLVPEEFRVIQQSPFYRADRSQDDTVYAEHRRPILKMTERPPSSPSRFDLKTRIFRSQSQSRLVSQTDTQVTRTKSPVALFEIVHRPPSQNFQRIHRQPSNPSISINPTTIIDDKSLTNQLANRPKLEKAPATPTIYQVKRGGKIYKVVVGYVSPHTSPMERNDLHLKTEGETDQIIKQLKKQQEKQRTIQSQIVPIGPAKFK